MEASAVNQPHPDDADAFFGEPDAAPTEATFNPETGTFDGPAKTPPPGPTDPAGEAETYREEHGEPAQARPAPASAAADAEQPSAAAPEAEKARGSLEREYIVFQKVALTEKALRHLLGEIESGKAPQPRVAFFELHRAVSRNDKHAIAKAHAKNKDSLGEVCDLAAVSARSFKERHVEPEEIPAERRLRIT